MKSSTESSSWAWKFFRILVELRSILEPFLWALFLVMVGELGKVWLGIILDGFWVLYSCSCGNFRSMFGKIAIHDLCYHRFQNLSVRNVPSGSQGGIDRCSKANSSLHRTAVVRV